MTSLLFGSSQKKKSSTLPSPSLSASSYHPDDNMIKASTFRKLASFFTLSSPSSSSSKSKKIVGPDSAVYVDRKAFSVDSTGSRSQKTSSAKRNLKPNIIQTTSSSMPYDTPSSSSGVKARNTRVDQQSYEDRGHNTRHHMPSSSTSSSNRATTSTTSTTSSSSSSPPKASSSVLCCDKCDGKHITDDCPYYKKPRDVHPDAQRGKKMGGMSSLPGATIHSARVVRQPGDGSCLFHSMSYGLKYGSAAINMSADRLRHEICQYIKHNPALPISDTPLSEWIKWDSNLTCSEYARRMSAGTWGGGIEMACTSLMYRCNVHVYERYGVLGYKRISAFDYPERPEAYPVIRVLYCGGVHYDALVVGSSR